MAEIQPPLKLKRLKKPNFTVAEENVIQQQVAANISVLNGKINNAVSIKQKNKIWEDITCKVNALGVAVRTSTEVRNKWRNTTREAKSVFTQYKMEQRKTGGGPAPKKPSAAVENVIALFQENASFKGVPGGLETNNFINDDEPETAAIPEDNDSQYDIFESARSEPSSPEHHSPSILQMPIAKPTCSALPVVKPACSATQSINCAMPVAVPVVKPVCSATQSSDCAMPVKTVKSNKRKITVHDVYEAQVNFFNGEVKKQQLEMKKLELQIRLLEKLNEKEEAQPISLSQIYVDALYQ